MKRALTALFAAVLFAFPLSASATLAPVYTVQSSTFGPPGGSRAVQGFITLGASDTYVTGGFAIAPSVFGFANQITSIAFGQVVASWWPVATFASGTATVKFYMLPQGASQILATATTATVTVPTGVTLTVNTPIMCQLNDAATGGGGTGTWAVTNAVSSCKQASATTFTITSIAAAPTNGGNFTWLVPLSGASNAELTSGAATASVVIPFIALGS